MPKDPTPSAAEVRKSQLADAMGDDGAEPIDLPPAAPVKVVQAAPPVPASPDMSALVKLLADAMAQSGITQADAMREAAQGARNPMPETYLNGGYPGKSVYSHPDGDLKTPRTALRCPMFLGVYNAEGKTTPAFNIFPDVCKESERVMLNALTPGKYRLTRNDDVEAICRVVEELDDFGAPIRVVIAVPQKWLSKEEQSAMPSQTRLLTQLTTEAAPAA